ncbi:MAG: hypothetical protein R3B70_28810 [Polyangiaceae bacterium]
MPPGIPNKARPRLEGFDVDEIKRAKERYIVRFYGRVDTREMARHIEQLDGLMAGRHTMVEIMRQPLTMRMLFHLYAPFQIPPEVDVARLYADYWERRVRTDTRPGHSLPVDSTDLGPAAGWLALGMLHDGSPTLDEQILEMVLRAHGVPVEHIGSLVDRGVLRRGEGTVEFFHQTFFEHAAARGVLAAEPTKGIALLAERMKEHPEDLLVAAVLEQSLVIASMGWAPLRATAELTMRTLLESGRMSLQSVAVAAYCRVKHPPASLEELVDSALAEAVLARRMIDLAPSMAESRVGDLFARFSSIWAASVTRPDAWRSCQHVLDHLSRLASRGGHYAKLTRIFLKEHRVREVAIERQDKADAKTPYLKVLSALAPHDLEVWDDFVALARGAKEDLLARTVSEMSHVAAHLHRECPAREMTLVMSDLRRDSTEVNRAWGELWDAEWRLRSLSFDAVLRAIAEERDPHGHLCMLNGLARFLMRGTAADGQAAWESYMAEEVMQRRADWNPTVWAELLRDPSSPPLDPAVVVAECIAAYLASTEDRRSAKALSNRINKAGCSVNLVGRLFSSPLTDDPERWLNEDDLGPLLAFACASCHRAAEEAMSRLIRAPRDHWKTATGTVGTMREHAFVRRIETFIALAGAVGDIEAVTGAIEKMTASEAQSLEACTPELRELLRRYLNSRSSTDRSGAARLWLELVRLSRSVPGDVAGLGLRECFERERNPTTRAWLVQLLGELAENDADVEAALRSASVSKDVNLRNKALPAWIRFVRRHGLVPSRALDIVQAAEALPTDAGRLRHAGWLVDDLVPTQMDVARCVLETIFLSGSLSTAGRQGFRDLRSTLRAPVRKWMAAAPTDLACRMLSLVPRIHPQLGCLVVEAAAKGPYESLRPHLAQLMKDPEVPAEVRGYIEEHIRIRKNVTSAPWPDLDDILLRSVIR